MKYPIELVEKAEYEVNVFERVASGTGIELIEEVKRLRLEIKELEKELGVLRGFARAALSTRGIYPLFERMLFGIAQRLGIIDESGKPTALLTGDNK